MRSRSLPEKREGLRHLRQASRLFRPRLSQVTAVLVGALAWLAVISLLHYSLDRETGTRTVVRMGYMPVVTNLACPLLDAASRTTSDTRFVAMKFSSFAEMGEALRNGHIDAGFMIAPLSIVLHQQDSDVRIVYIGNRHESTLVVRSSLPAKDFGDLAGHTLAVPIRYSGHNICARQLQEKYGVAGRDVRIVEMNPPDMPAALATGALDAYFVGEPFAMRSVLAGNARVLHYAEQVWPGFICNLMVVRGDFVKHSPKEVGQLVSGAVRSGLWARDHRSEAADIVSGYWSQEATFVRKVLDTYKDRIVWDRYLPKVDEIDFLAREMVRLGLLQDATTTDLVDDSFARAVELGGISDLPSILNPPPGAAEATGTSSHGRP